MDYGDSFDYCFEASLKAGERNRRYMDKDTVQLEKTIREYRDILSRIGHTKMQSDNLGWNRIEKELESEADWTAEGAHLILGIARNYGAFVLRNALGLAIALNIEDGSMGL